MARLHNMSKLLFKGTKGPELLGFLRSAGGVPYNSPAPPLEHEKSPAINLT